MKLILKSFSFAVIAGIVLQTYGETIVVPNAYESVSRPGGLSLPFNPSGARWPQIYIRSEFNGVFGDIIRWFDFCSEPKN
jgi:hypothetical protein